MLNGILSIFRKTGKPQLDQAPAEKAFPNVPAETEVAIIKQFLERKFDRKFQARVKVEGYLGGDMEYKLTIDDYSAGPSVNRYHSVWGRPVKNVLDVHRAFDLRETAIAGSREEMILRATAEGLI